MKEYKHKPTGIMKNNYKNAEQFIHEYEKIHSADWLSGIPDLVKFLNEYGSKIENEFIPNDAHSLEVFSIKDCDDSPTGKQAFIGYKLDNGNFHFIGVPYTEPVKKESWFCKFLKSFSHKC